MTDLLDEDLISMIKTTRDKRKTNIYLEESLKKLLKIRLDLVNKLLINKKQLDTIIKYLLKMNNTLSKKNCLDDLADIKIDRNKREINHLTQLRKKWDDRINYLNI